MANIVFVCVSQWESEWVNEIVSVCVSEWVNEYEWLSVSEWERESKWVINLVSKWMC